MKSVGEAMALGRNFAQALQKALRSVEQKGSEFAWPADPRPLDELLAEVARPHDGRLQKVQQALWLGASPAQLYEVTAIDPWFLEQIGGINDVADQVRAADRLSPSLMRRAKQYGFSDAQIGAARGIPTEVAPKADRFGKQIRYADRRGIPFVWFATGEVKDIRSGEQVPADPDAWEPPVADRRLSARQPDRRCRSSGHG